MYNRLGHQTRFLMLVALALALRIPLHERARCDHDITNIMNKAAINDRTERDKVYDAAKNNTIATLPPAEVKPAQDVRNIMLDHRFFYRPKF